MATDDQEEGMGDRSKDKLLDIRGLAILNFRSKWRPEIGLAGKSEFFLAIPKLLVTFESTYTVLTIENMLLKE